jgi:hypothetical protein
VRINEGRNVVSAIQPLQETGCQLGYDAAGP